MTPEQRTKIIQALLEKDMDRIRQAKGEVILISTFYEMLMFCNSDRPEEDYKKIKIAEGPFLELLKRLNTDKEAGQLTGKPFWMVPADGLTDAEIEKYKDSL